MYLLGRVPIFWMQWHEQRIVLTFAGMVFHQTISRSGYGCSRIMAAIHSIGRSGSVGYRGGFAAGRRRPANAVVKFTNLWGQHLIKVYIAHFTQNLAQVYMRTEPNNFHSIAIIMKILWKNKIKQRAWWTAGVRTERRRLRRLRRQGQTSCTKSLTSRSQNKSQVGQQRGETSFVYEVGLQIPG